MASEIISQEYAQWLAELKEKIRNSKLRAGPQNKYGDAFPLLGIR
jgi:hypothetical protein